MPNDKVYIVTSGSYSDYGIRRVFLDGEKAHKYASYHNDYEVEEWDTYDNEIVTPIYWVDVAYRPGHFEFHLQKSSSDHWSKPNPDIGTFYYHEQRILRLERIVKSHSDDLSTKYERICQDLHAQIQSLITVEGWTEDMIDEWLKDKGHSEGAADDAK